MQNSKSSKSSLLGAQPSSCCSFARHLSGKMISKLLICSSLSTAQKGLDGCDHVEYSSHPKNPDPSKVAILRTNTPLVYRFKPLHCRVQGFLGHQLSAQPCLELRRINTLLVDGKLTYLPPQGTPPQKKKPALCPLIRPAMKPIFLRGAICVRGGARLTSHHVVERMNLPTFPGQRKKAIKQSHPNFQFFV